MISVKAIDKIILGTVQFGLDYGINNSFGKPNPGTVFSILNTAYDAGIRILDTAEAYGSAHEIIGQFHKAHPSKKFHIITKLPHHIDGNIYQKIDKYFQQLNISKLKGLLFHSFESYKLNKASINLLNDLKKSQDIEYIGVSIYTNAQMEEVVLDNDVDIIQLPYNMFDNHNHRGQILNKAKNRGKIIHTRSAFLQGLFFTSLQDENKVIQALMDELRFIRELSENSGESIQKLALNYCLQQSNINNVLIGVDNLNQLNQNLEDADFSLSEELIKKIDSIHVKDINLLNPSLWNQ